MNKVKIALIVSICLLILETVILLIFVQRSNLSVERVQKIEMAQNLKLETHTALLFTSYKDIKPGLSDLIKMQKDSNDWINSWCIKNKVNEPTLKILESIIAENIAIMASYKIEESLGILTSKSDFPYPIPFDRIQMASKNILTKDQQDKFNEDLRQIWLFWTL